MPTPKYIGGSVITDDDPMPTGDAGTSAIFGAVDDEPYTGSGDGTVISILKGMYALLNDIKTNTTPV